MKRAGRERRGGERMGGRMGREGAGKEGSREKIQVVKRKQWTCMWAAGHRQPNYAM